VHVEGFVRSCLSWWPGGYSVSLMKVVQESELSPASSKDVQGLIRQLRVVITNARIYASGHGQRISASAAIWDFLLELSEGLGVVLVEVVPWGLLVNGKGLETPDKGARIVTDWLQERQVRNFVFDGSGRLDVLTAQLDLLADLGAATIERMRQDDLPELLREPPLIVNVMVNRLAPPEETPAKSNTDLARQTTITSGLTPGDVGTDLEPGGLAGAPTGEVENLALEGSGPDAGAGESPEDPDTEPEPEPEAPPFDWSEVAVEAVDATFGQLCEEGADDFESDFESDGEDGEAGDEIDREALESELSRALESLLERGAEGLCRYLAVALPEAEPAQRLRRAVLNALREGGEPRAEVLGILSQQLRRESDEGLGTSLFQACEELVPAAIQSDELHTVAAFSKTLDAIVERDTLLVDRAEAARIYLSSPAVVETMVRKMEVLPRDQCDLIRNILRSFGVTTMPQLFELMMTANKRSVRLSLVEVIVHHLQVAVAADGRADELLAPFFRELARAHQNPWYVTRNVVFILTQLNTLSCQRALLSQVDQAKDPRVLAALARGLLQTQTESSVLLLNKLALDPRFTDGGGLFDVLRHMHAHSPEELHRVLEQRLAGKDVAESVAEGSLLGLAYGAGEDALPFLSKLVTEKAGLLKRPVFCDAVRGAALEAMATIRGKAARDALGVGREDKESTIRRRAVELMHMEPSRASASAYRRLGVNPDGGN